MDKRKYRSIYLAPLVPVRLGRPDGLAPAAANGGRGARGGDNREIFDDAIRHPARDSEDHASCRQ